MKLNFTRLYTDEQGRVVMPLMHTALQSGFLCMRFKNKLYIYADNTPIRELLEKIAEKANFKFTNFHNFYPFGVHGMVSRYFYVWDKGKQIKCWNI